MALAERRGVSLASLSRLIGKNASYLQQFVRKGSPRKLEEEDRATLSRFFGVAEEELGRAKDNYPVAKDQATGEWASIPRLAVCASAGCGASGEGEQMFDAIRFSVRWLREKGLQADMLSAIAVTGDSMEPALRDGDEILVDRTPRPLRDGIHVVRIDGALMVKRIDTARPGTIVLISENPIYRPIECRAQDVQVIGRVVWKSGRI